MPLVYGGLETHTKHDWDTEIGTQKRIYIIPKRKSLQYSQIATNQNRVWDKSGRIGTRPNKSGQLPKLCRGTREFQYLQEVRVELKSQE